MNRGVVLAFCAAGALATGVALSPAARAGEPGAGEKKVEKRVLIHQGPGGGFLGVGLTDLEGDARGAKVRSVESDSPAGKAGVKEGDVIVRFDGEAVRSAAQLARLVRETPPGRSLPVEVLRDGASQKLTVTVGEREMPLFGGGGFPQMHGFQMQVPPPSGEPGLQRFWHMAPPAPEHHRLGIEFIDMGEQLAAAYKLAAKDGVLVVSVDEGSPAAKAGIEAGDVVLAFAGHAVENGHDLRQQVKEAGAGAVKVKVQRDGKPLELEATLGGTEREQAPASAL